MMAVERELLTLAEVASMLAICRRSVYRLVGRGELSPPVKVGRCVRFRMIDVRSYITKISGERS